MTAKTLTKAEEQVMQYLWELGKGFLKDILEHFSRTETSYQHCFYHFKNFDGKRVCGA